MTMQTRREQGFSAIKLLFFMAVLGAAIWYGWLLIPVYNTAWKVQDAFDAISRNMADASEDEIRTRLPQLFKIKYIDQDGLPQEFFDNLKIEADGARVAISSYYHVTIWPLGPVEGVDPDADYDPSELKGMDKIRDKLRLDLDFEPSAQTP